MVKGIKFEIPNKWGMELNNIIYGINIENYIFKINNGEIYTYDNNFLFEKEQLTGEQFKKIISGTKYYIANIRAYFKRMYNDTKTNIHNDYLNNSWNLMISITDSRFVNVYCKNIKELEQIKLNAKKNNYINIEYI